jgi:hypothetical protein
LDIP